MATTDPSQLANSTSLATLFHTLEHYPFSTDPDFLSGLSAILSGPSQSTPPSTLILSARCFYYSRKYNVPVDVSAYQSWRAQQSAEALSSLEADVAMLRPGNGVGRDFVPTPEVTPEKREAGERTVNGGGRRRAMSQGIDGVVRVGGDSTQQARTEEQAPPTSFQEIMEMIREGKPIPGIKDVPDTVLTGQGSEASKGVRRKPWEVRSEQSAGGSGLFAEQASR